jgi:hypothetical protein
MMNHEYLNHESTEKGIALPGDSFLEARNMYFYFVFMDGLLWACAPQRRCDRNQLMQLPNRERSFELQEN